jgi:hypothetical protein
VISRSRSANGSAKSRFNRARCSDPAVGANKLVSPATSDGDLNASKLSAACSAVATILRTLANQEAEAGQADDGTNYERDEDGEQTIRSPQAGSLRPSKRS